MMISRKPLNYAFKISTFATINQLVNIWYNQKLHSLAYKLSSKTFTGSKQFKAINSNFYRVTVNLWDAMSKIIHPPRFPHRIFGTNRNASAYRTSYNISQSPENRHSMSP